MVCGYRCCPHTHVPAFSGILHGEKKKHRKADYRKWAKSTLQIHLHLGGIYTKALYSTKPSAGQTSFFILS